MNRYKITLDFDKGHTIIERKTGLQFELADIELEDIMNYAKAISNQDLSHENHLKSIDNYITTNILN